MSILPSLLPSWWMAVCAKQSMTVCLKLNRIRSHLHYFERLNSLISIFCAGNEMHNFRSGEWVPSLAVISYCCNSAIQLCWYRAIRKWVPTRVPGMHRAMSAEPQIRKVWEERIWESVVVHFRANRPLYDFPRNCMQHTTNRSNGSVASAAPAVRIVYMHCVTTRKDNIVIKKITTGFHHPPCLVLPRLFSRRRLGRGVGVYMSCVIIF